MLCLLGQVGAGHGEDPARLPPPKPLPANHTNKLKKAFVSSPLHTQIIIIHTKCLRILIRRGGSPIY